MNSKGQRKFKLATLACAIAWILHFPAAAQTDSADSSHSEYAAGHISAKEQKSGTAVNKEPDITVTEEQLKAQTAADSKASKKATGNTASQNQEDFIISTEDDSKDLSPLEEKIQQQHENQLNFATQAHELMQAKSTADYLANPRYSDASTFPMRLFAQIKRNEWEPSPAKPIPANDMACYFDVPSYRKPLEFDSNSEPIHVEADDVSGDLADKNNELIYKGNVDIRQGDRLLKTDVAHYKGKQQLMTTSGSTTYSGPLYTVKTQDTAVSHLDTKQTTLNNATFNLNGSAIRGSSKEHLVDNANNAQTIKGAMITSCPTQDSSWQMKATTVELDKEADVGHAWNSTVWIADTIPVFYMPYINFPLSNKRKTGFLYPGVSLGSDSFTASVPFYWNIAPNYDWLITPRWRGDHKWEFDNTFRAMPFANTTATIIFNYFPDDTSWTRDGSTSDHERWYFNFKAHSWFLDHDLNFYVNHAKVRNSDYSYFTDIAQKGAAVTDDHLVQSYKATYDKTRYDISIEARKYQTLINPAYHVFHPFELMPQVKFNYYDTYDRLLFKNYFEFTRFSKDSEASDSSANSVRSFSTNRIHLEPSLKYNLYSARGTFLNAGGRLFLTHYDQGDVNSLNKNYRSYIGVDETDSHTTRALYELELHGKTTFERKVLDMRHTQTIEPEIKYTYIPYKNQDKIALYDTATRLEDYYSLFSYRRYAGIDRIADTNTVTAGITTRLLDAHDREILRFGIAQAYSFVKTRTDLGIVRDSYLRSLYNQSNSRSPISAILDFSPIPEVTLHTSGTYDEDGGKLYSYDASLRYQNNSGYLAGISYRFYRDGNYSYATGLARDLRQVGFEGSIPLTNRLKLTGALYRDVEQEYNIDTKVGILYEECCWSVGFVYEKYLKMKSNPYRQTQKEVIGFQFTLKNFFGMQADGSTSPSSTSTHFLPAVDPTNLNN